MDLSIVIPIYNEEKRVKESILQINSFLKNNQNIDNYEIICVVDGPTDKTREILESINLENLKLTEKRENKGKGYSTKQGMLLAKYPYALFTDTDLATPLEELNKFIPYVKDYDIIIASRHLKESEVERSPWRVIIGKVFVLFNRLVLNLNIQDTQCGFKLFNKESIEAIFPLQKTNRFAFDVELLFLARKKGFKIKEIPVKWKHSGESTVRIARDTFGMARDTIKVRINDILRKY
tara:strand:- start:1240 stop:1947 length:708 start_codon:yes stop_codon:yes gene_type:complete